jgi:hypothetical protein
LPHDQRRSKARFKPRQFTATKGHKGRPRPEFGLNSTLLHSFVSLVLPCG